MKLKTYRSKMGLTLQDVADATGISLWQISKHERGHRAPTIENIAVYQTFTEGAVRFEDWLLQRVDQAPQDMARETASAVAP